MLEWQKMYQVDQVKLTKYGFRFNLLRSSSFLAVIGIIFSIIGIIGSFACFGRGLMFLYSGLYIWIGSERIGSGLFIIGAILLIVMIPYLAMWILLKIKTSKQDIYGIERIGKVYIYVSGSLEIITSSVQIIYSAWTLASVYYLNLSIGTQSVDIIGAAICFVSACLKIHEVRVENNKLIGTNLGFRYGLLALYMIGFIIVNITNYGLWSITALIVGGVYFILDIGLTVILHSIRVDRENTAGTENPMKNF